METTAKRKEQMKLNYYKIHNIYTVVKYDF